MTTPATYHRINWLEYDKIINAFESYVRKHQKTYDLILGISRGGLIPAITLSHRLDIPQLKSIRILRNKTNKPYSEKITPCMENFSFNELQGKNILVVDDVSSTGETLRELYKQFAQHAITTYEAFVMVKFNIEAQPLNSLNICFYGHEGHRWTVFPWENSPG